MNESTARAERYDLQTSPSSFFLWEVPQKPVAVRISYGLMGRLEREAVESFRSVTSRGSEIGGLLLGSAEGSDPVVVSVTGYQLIDCDYSRGPLYRLSGDDLERMQQALEEDTGRESVVGYFRTHTRKGIAIDPDDLAILDEHFPEPHHIALLIRPFATKASTAGIFIREDGKIQGDTSYLEFPFRTPRENKPFSDGPEARAVAAPSPAPQASKPAVRAQIVPIASRREIALPAIILDDKLATIPPPGAAPAVAAEPMSGAGPVVEERAKSEAPSITSEPGQKQEPPAIAAVEATPAGNPGRAEVAGPSMELATVAVEDQHGATRGLAVPSLLVQDEPRFGKGLKLLLAALASIALFVVLFVYPGLIRQIGKAPNGGGADTSALQLHVERSSGELLLTWNRDSAVVQKATKAVLTINDGARRENIDLDLTQLRNGSIVYSPQSADISFKMEVVGGSGTTASESVRVLRTRPSPLEEATGAQPNGTAKPAPAGSAAAAPSDIAAPAAQGAETQPTEEAAEPVSKPVPLRPFQSESLGQRLRPALPSDMPDAPAVGGGVVATAVPGVNLGTVAGSAPRPPAPAAPAPSPVASETKSAAPKGGQIQQAVLIVKKDPEYTRMARQAGARGSVRLTATIGADGKVKKVRVISGHPMLQAAAIDAVKQWIYKPTLLNGQPVETETEIVLNFLGDR